MLNAQSELITAKINLVEAKTHGLVSSFGILAAIGALDSKSLGLQVPATN